MNHVTPNTIKSLENNIANLNVTINNYNLKIKLDKTFTQSSLQLMTNQRDRLDNLLETLKK